MGEFKLWFFVLEFLFLIVNDSRDNGTFYLEQVIDYDHLKLQYCMKDLNCSSSMTK